MRIKILLLVSLLGFAGNTLADVWAEREALAAISEQLLALESLVDEAEARKSNARTRFSYFGLKKDLAMVRQGIENHLTQPLDPIMPEAIKPVDQSYTSRY